MFFLPQQVATRPALIHAFASAPSAANIMSHAPYSAPSGSKYIVALDSLGAMNMYNVSAGTSASLGQVEVGSRFSWTEAFSKIFFALFDPTEAANFANTQFAGTDLPRYVNQFGQMNRLTVDGPGGGYSVALTDQAPLNITGMARFNNIVTATFDATDYQPDYQVGWFMNPVDTEGTPGLVPGINAEGPLNSINQDYALGASTIRQSSGPSSTSPGNVITVYYNRSDLPGIQDYDLCNAWAANPNGTYVQLTNIAQYGLVDGIYLVTQANAQNLVPPGGSHHWYFFTVAVGGAAQAIGSDSNVAYGTTATYQRLASASFGGNELFQPIGGSSATGGVTVTGDGTGTIHVATSQAIESLPVGAWLYLYIPAPSPAAITYWSNNSETGEVTIVVPGTNWGVGTQILLNGFLGNQTPAQPVFLNGQTVVITGVSGDAYSFSFPGGFSSGGLAGSSGGTAAPVASSYPSQWIQVTSVSSPNNFTYLAVNNTQTTPLTGSLYDYFGALNTALSLTPPLAGQTTLPTSAAQGIQQGFQILDIDLVHGVIKWYQSGPDDIYSGGHPIQLVPQSAVAPGPRSAFVFFISQDGAASPGGPPILFSSNGGSDYPEFTLPLGPPGTIARGIAVTPAYGADFFTLPAALVQTTLGPLQTPGIIVQDNTTTSIVLDWSDAALVAAIPVSGTEALGSDFGDLTSTINLPPCLGVVAYNQMLAWYGEINNTKNFLNMSMQGGAESIASGVPQGIPEGWNDTTEYNGITPDQSGSLALASDGSGWVYEMGQTYGATSGSVVTNGYPFQELLNSNVYDNSWGVYDSLFGPNYGGQFTFIFGAAPGTGGSNVGPWPAGGITIRFLGTFANPVVTGTLTFTQAQLESGISQKFAIPAGSYHYEIVGQSGGYYVGVSLALFPAEPGNSMISQPAYEDVWGADILLPKLNYLIRFRGQLVSGTANGNLVFALYSPSVGLLASATVAVSSFTTTLAWIDAAFSASMPASIPSDTVLYVSLTGNSSAQVIAISDLLLVNKDQPILQNQVRFSYVDNEFGYDNENGYTVGFATSQALVSAFVMRNYLYFNGENDLFVTQATNSVPSEWPANLEASDCGGSGPNATASLQDLSWWVGRQGVQVFNGTQPKKISEEIQPDMDLTNWNAIVTTAMEHDAIQRILYISYPTGSSTSPNLLQTMNHRMADANVNVMDPVHISSYTGKMIATDLARKWVPMRRSINSLANCWVNESGSIERVVSFGGGAGDYGQVYYQDFVNYPPTNPAATAWNSNDADYGQISSYYTTYFFFSHDVEQNALLALYRKLFAYMSFHVIGTGHVTPTPYVNSLVTPWPVLPSWTLQLTDPGIDYETPLNVTGNRMAIKYACTDGAFQLTHMIVSARRDLVFPVRGAF